jgi:hypothetical protein
MLYNKVRGNEEGDAYNYQKPVKNFSFKGNIEKGIPAIKLNSMITGLQSRSNRRFLDLERGGVIDFNQLKRFISSGSVPIESNPDFSINPAYL